MLGAMIRKIPFPVTVLIFSSLVLALACGTADDPDPSKDQLALVWEAWEKIDQSYAGWENVDPEEVVSTALQSMLDLSEAPPYPFLTLVGRLRGQAPPEVPKELADVWRGMVLHQQRWPEFDRSELASAAISGIVAGLGDPMAAYLDADIYPDAKENLEQRLEGEYKGIGARVVVQDEKILLFPYADTPAEKAGIEAGDVLLEVGGEPVAGKSLEEVVDRVAGPEGTKVTLLMGRSSEPEPLELEVFRGTISLPSVSRQLVPGGIGYIYVSTFRDNTGEQVFEALEALNQFDMLALILDLRGNPGGSAGAAKEAAGQFLPDGTVFGYLESREGKRIEETIDPNEDRLDLDDLLIAVLVNEQTVREAEIMAAALQDSGRATLFGTTTFGDASAYEFVELSNGSAMYLPVSRWYTPSGKLLDRSGLKPDFEVEFQVEGGYGRESQFNRAYEYLDGQLPPFR